MQKVVGSNPISRFLCNPAAPVVGSPESPAGERSGGDHQGAKVRNQHQPRRCRAGRRHLFGGCAGCPGDLDPTFSGDGKQTTDFARLPGDATAVRPAGRQDRRGWHRRHSPARSDFALARYNPNGSLDTSFSGDGKQTTDFGGLDARRSGVALQADGKIVVVGASRRRSPATSRSPATTPTARSTRASPATASRRPTSGASDGATEWRSRRTARSSRSAPRGAGGRRLRARPLQPERLARHELLRRRQADDRLRRAPDRATGVALQARRQDRRGRLRRAPSRLRARPLQPERLARHELLRRRQADDRLRRRRRGDGVALQADGKIVAVGDGGEPTSPSPATTPTARSTRASPATASRRPTSGVDAANGVALQADGKIVAVGGSGGTGGDFALARYNPNGSLDTSFSGDGKQTTDFGGFRRGERGGAPGRRQDRRGRPRPRRSAHDFALARYNPDGSLDPSFSGDGKQTTDFGARRRRKRGGDPGGRQDRRGRQTALRSTSRSPATTPTARSTRASPATASRRPTSGAMLTRARRSGAPGRRQDRRGRRQRTTRPRRLRCSLATTPTGRSTRASPATASRRPTSGGFGDRATGVALQDDGKIVAVGTAARPGPLGDFALARYNPNGSLDPSFSGDGKQTTDFGGAFGDRANGVASGRRQDRRGRRRRRLCSERLRARPLQPERLARPELLRRRQADGPTSGARRCKRGGAAGRRQDRRRRLRRRRSYRQRLRARPLQPQRLARLGLLRRRQGRRPTSAPAARTGRMGWRSRATARSSRRRPHRRWSHRQRLRARPLQPERLARPSFSGDGKQRTDFASGTPMGERGGAPGRRQHRRRWRGPRREPGPRFRACPVKFGPRLGRVVGSQPGSPGRGRGVSGRG